MKEKKKIFIIVIVILTLLVVGLSSYIIYDNVIKDRKTTDNNDNLIQLNLNDSLVTQSMEQLAKVGYNYCSLDTKYLKEFYSGNFAAENSSKYSLILHAISTQEIPAMYSDEEMVTIKITDMNFGLEKLFFNPNKISYQDIKSVLEENRFLNEYYIDNDTNDSIKIGLEVYGCEADSDILIREIQKAEKNGDYLYIYAKIGFGFYDDHIEGIEYYKDINKEILTETFYYDYDDMNTYDQKPNLEKFNTYKYTFMLIDNIYKLVDVKL